MKYSSSCVAVFDCYDDTLSVATALLEQEISSDHISLVDKTRSAGPLTTSAAPLADYLSSNGVPELYVESYLSIVQSGASLLIVVGNYHQIEQASELIDLPESAFLSLHFNAA